jgi:hypothetical protein
MRTGLRHEVQGLFTHRQDAILDGQVSLQIAQPTYSQASQCFRGVLQSGNVHAALD